MEPRVISHTTSSQDKQLVQIPFNLNCNNIWKKINKNHMFLICQYFSLNEILLLRLVNQEFKIKITLCFPQILINMAGEICQAKSLIQQTQSNLPQQDLELTQKLQKATISLCMLTKRDLNKLSKQNLPQNICDIIKPLIQKNAVQLNNNLYDSLTKQDQLNKDFINSINSINLLTVKQINWAAGVMIEYMQIVCEMLNSSRYLQQKKTCLINLEKKLIQRDYSIIQRLVNQV